MRFPAASRKGIGSRSSCRKCGSRTYSGSNYCPRCQDGLEFMECWLHDLGQPPCEAYFTGYSHRLADSMTVCGPCDLKSHMRTASESELNFAMWRETQLIRLSDLAIQYGQAAIGW